MMCRFIKFYNKMITSILYRCMNERIYNRKAKNVNLRIVLEVLELLKLRNVFTLEIGVRIKVFIGKFTSARLRGTLRSDSIEVLSSLLLNSHGFLLGQMNVTPVWPSATLHFSPSFLSGEILYESVNEIGRYFPFFCLQLNYFHALYGNMERKISDDAYLLRCSWWATWSSTSSV